MWEERPESERETDLDYANFLQRLRLQGHPPECWTFWEDTEGKFHSQDLRDDTACLHRRGYLFCKYQDSMVPTMRSYNVYDKMKELAISREHFL